MDFKFHSILSKISGRSGFTLIEVTFAISVMVVGVVGTLAAVQYSTSSISQSCSRLTAAYLAQEGIETARNLRDGNWLKQGVGAPSRNPSSFHSSIGSPVSSGMGSSIPSESSFSPGNMIHWDNKLGVANVGDKKEMEVDYKNKVFKPLSCVPNCGFHQLDFIKRTKDGFYNYSSGRVTPFKRKVLIEKAANNMLKVRSKVYWDKGKHSITVQENLYNWHSNE